MPCYETLSRMVCKVIMEISNQARDKRLCFVFYPPDELSLCTVSGESNIIHDNHKLLTVGDFINFMAHFEMALQDPLKRCVVPMKHIDQSMSNGEALPSPDGKYMIFGTKETGPAVTFTLDCGSKVELDATAIQKMISYKAEIREYFSVGIHPEICTCVIQTPFFALPCSSATTTTTNTVTNS